MKKLILLFVASMAFAGVSLMAQTQEPARPLGDQELKEVVSRLDQRAAAFRESLKKELDASQYNETPAEDVLNQFARDLAAAADRLERHVTKGEPVAADVEAVLSTAASIDHFFNRNRMELSAQGEWKGLSGMFDGLAQTYGVAWHPASRPRNEGVVGPAPQ